MNTWLADLTVWLPGPGDAHVTDFAGMDMPEPPLIDVLDEPDIPPEAADVFVDDFDEPRCANSQPLRAPVEEGRFGPRDEPTLTSDSAV